MTKEQKRKFFRTVEFFEDDNRRLSMSRLLCFLSFWPATLVLLNSKSSDIFMLYIGAYVLSYIGGKTADIFGSRPSNEKRSMEKNS